jgi:two-component system, LytTR family, sensor histidine kinase AlgZ
MHPLLARLDYAAAYVGAWLVAGMLLCTSLARQGVAWADALVFVVPTFAMYGFVCLSAWYVSRAMPLTTRRAAAVATASGAAALSGGVMWTIIAELWMALLDTTPGLQGAAAVGRVQVPFLFSVAVILYLLVLSIHYVALAYEAARAAEHQQFELQVLTRDAELRALRAQLNPHFLYNSLNSISALTTVDPEGARRMCVLLGDFLRKTLKVSTLDSITIADELALVDAFIGIEQVRFGSRLTVERQIDESALACRVPPLLLQPLLENAVAHGIGGLIDGGSIVFTVVKRDGRVLLRIDNPRDPDVPPRRHGGVGLENVRRRVQTAFPDRARVEAAAEAGRFRVELNLPCIEE